MGVCTAVFHFYSTAYTYLKNLCKEQGTDDKFFDIVDKFGDSRFDRTSNGYY